MCVAQHGDDCVWRNTVVTLCVWRNTVVTLCVWRNSVTLCTGRVEPGLPRLAPPPFSASLDNSTVTFVDMVQTLGSAVIMMPIVMVLANIAIAKAFSECPTSFTMISSSIVQQLL